MLFEVYAVHPSLKMRFAALNFQGAAATWLQTMERRGRITYWTQHCELVMELFDKNQYQYQLLLKQFDTLWQRGMVEDYQVEFEKIAHGILLYNNSYEEIRSVISLHRPRDVDTASALALLQEEVLARSRLKIVGKDFQRGFAKTASEKP